jgi:hypothetical protein
MVGEDSGASAIDDEGGDDATPSALDSSVPCMVSSMALRIQREG